MKKKNKKKTSKARLFTYPLQFWGSLLYMLAISSAEICDL